MVCKQRHDAISQQVCIRPCENPMNVGYARTDLSPGLGKKMHSFADGVLPQRDDYWLRIRDAVLLSDLASHDLALIANVFMWWGS